MIILIESLAVFNTGSYHGAYCFAGLPNLYLKEAEDDTYENIPKFTTTSAKSIVEHGTLFLQEEVESHYWFPSIKGIQRYNQLTNLKRRVHPITRPQ